MSDFYLDEDEFIARAENAGFKTGQAQFLFDYLSQKPHTHTAEQIEDLEETVEEILDEHES